MKKLTPKEFALREIAPYYKDPSICAIKGVFCLNLLPDGRMCVAGKNLLPKVREKNPTSSIYSIFSLYKKIQSSIFIPESVDILTVEEWGALQDMHDSIARREDDLLDINISKLDLFTLEELKEYCKTLN